MIESNHIGGVADVYDAMGDRIPVKTEKPYTDEELREFDHITNALSSPQQMVRLDARLTLLPRFIEKHGKAKCDAMFEVLKARDAKKEKARGR